MTARAVPGNAGELSRQIGGSFSRCRTEPSQSPGRPTRPTGRQTAAAKTGRLTGRPARRRIAGGITCNRSGDRTSEAPWVMICAPCRAERVVRVPTALLAHAGTANAQPAVSDLPGTITIFLAWTNTGPAE